MIADTLVPSHTRKLYADPIEVSSDDECFFYHFMDLPEIGEVGETWDLRGCVDNYLGRLDYQGKRVLDVGTASGYLSFEMEKRGAQVVSFDMPSVESWNFVPHYKRQSFWSKMVANRSRCDTQMKNAYWRTRDLLGSKTQVHYGNVYDLPLELGNFDVVFMGMILPHLRDPFQALYSASRLATDKLIVTNPGKKSDWLKRLLRTDRYKAKFIPSATNINSDVWWALSHSCIERMLETIGFEVIDRVECSALCYIDGKPKSRPNISLVAKRIGGDALGTR